jgi:hypothetical protein
VAAFSDGSQRNWGQGTLQSTDETDGCKDDGGQTNAKDLGFADGGCEGGVEGGDGDRLEDVGAGAPFSDDSRHNWGQRTLQSTDGGGNEADGENTDTGGLEFATGECEAGVEGGVEERLEGVDAGAAFSDGNRLNWGQRTLQSTDGAGEREADDRREGVAGELRRR